MQEKCDEKLPLKEASAVLFIVIFAGACRLFFRLRN